VIGNNKLVITSGFSTEFIHKRVEFMWTCTAMLQFQALSWKFKFAKKYYNI